MWNYWSFNLVVSPALATGKLWDDRLSEQMNTKNNHVAFCSSMEHRTACETRILSWELPKPTAVVLFTAGLNGTQIFWLKWVILTSKHTGNLCVTTPFKTRGAAPYGLKFWHLMSYDRSMLDQLMYVENLDTHHLKMHICWCFMLLVCPSKVTGYCTEWLSYWTWASLAGRNHLSYEKCTFLPAREDHVQ